MLLLLRNHRSIVVLLNPQRQHERCCSTRNDSHERCCSERVDIAQCAAEYQRRRWKNHHYLLNHRQHQHCHHHHQHHHHHHHQCSCSAVLGSSMNELCSSTDMELPLPETRQAWAGKHYTYAEFEDWYGASALLIWLEKKGKRKAIGCLLYTSPSPRDKHRSRMPASA